MLKNNLRTGKSCHEILIENLQKRVPVLILFKKIKFHNFLK